jgi:prophage antirepressor-like protein
MNELAVFVFDRQEQKVRTVKIDGQAWFVGNDVCYLLGYKDPTTAIRSHCKGVAKLHPLETHGGIQEMRIINQADVLRLITGSTLPAAMRIEAWIFEEVIPKVLTTGTYSINERLTLPGSRRPIQESARKQLEETKEAVSKGENRADLVLHQFILENFTITGREKDKISVKNAYELYCTYAEQPLAMNEFAENVSFAFRSVTWWHGNLNGLKKIKQKQD